MVPARRFSARWLRLDVPGMSNTLGASASSQASDLSRGPTVCLRDAADHWVCPNLLVLHTRPPERAKRHKGDLASDALMKNR
jgi:hypothetical protein